jgi:NADH-quinone oxidoreductase subunit B
MEGLLLLQERVGAERRPLSWVAGEQRVARPDRPSLRDRKRAERQQARDLRSPDEL